MLIVDKKNCRQCFVCTSHEAIIVGEDDYPKIDEAKCVNEDECIKACPFGVIKQK